MSYRDPKVIDDKSGLIIPNAIAAGVANIAKQWGAELGRQRDLNLKNKKEDLANDNKVEADSALLKSSLKAAPGKEKMVKSAQEQQYKVIDDLETVRKELNNRNLPADRKQELRQEELALLNGLESMNASFAKVTIEMDKAVKLKKNSAVSQGKTAATSEENLAFSYGFHEGTSSYSYTPGSRQDGVYVPPKFQIISAGKTSDLSQFNSDDFSTTFEVTQLQPEASLAIKKKLKDSKNKFVQGVLEENTTMTTKDVFDSSGKKSGTQNVVSTLATPETNDFLNNQLAMVQAGIQEAGTPENKKQIMMYQYAMSEEDFNAIYGTGGVTDKSVSVDPKLQGSETLDNANNKLRYSIAVNNASEAGLEITNPDAGPNEPYVYASVYRSNPSGISKKNEDNTIKAAKLRDITATFTSTLKGLGTMEKGPNKDMALFMKATGVRNEMNLGTKSKPERITGFTKNDTANQISYNVGKPFYGNNLTDLELEAIDLVHYGGQTDMIVDENGATVKAADYLASQGKINANARTIDFKNKDSVIVGIMDLYGLDNVQARKYYNTYFN